MSESSSRESNGWRQRMLPMVSGSIGNVVEWYDWTIYGLLAVVFSKQIFTSQSALGSLIESLITFAIGFLFRPLGSVLLSPLADRIGRQRMLSYTVLAMGASSLIIAVTPPASAIGLAAPALFLLARVVQGLSAGGEFQTSIAYLVEHAPPGRRGLAGSIALISTVGATLVATVVVSLTTLAVPGAAMAAWGWRVPFLIGAASAAIGLYLRVRSPETPTFRAIDERDQLERRPLRTIFTRHPMNLVRVLSLQILTVAFYLWTVFLPTLAHLFGGLPLSQGLAASTGALVVLVVLLPVVGHLSDRFGRRPFLIAAAIGFIALPYPAFLALHQPNVALFLLVDVLGCALLACVDGVMGALFCELFPPQVRSTGIGVPYALTSAAFGGTAPLIAAALIQAGVPDLMAFYVMAIAIFSLCIYLFAMPETRGRQVEQEVGT
jgi:MFS transporter, MHS family, alpha-ketoglutarate permease